MKKLLISVSVLASMSVFATDNTNNFSTFQKFDNQISIGVSDSQMMLSNGATNQSLLNNQTMSLDVERQFNNGVWANINAYMMTMTNSLGSQATGVGMGTYMPVNQNPFLGGFNAKGGYSFALLPDRILVTPYALLGRNTNLAMSTVVANNYTNATNDFFYSTGFGARIQYVVNPYIDVYLDQSYAFNWDQSAPATMPAQNSQQFTTTLGAKYNVYEQLQLGVGLFYDNYQYTNNAPATTSLTGGSAPNGATVSIYQPQYDFGAKISIGMTF